MEWDIRNILKSVLGKIAEVSINENTNHVDIYLENILGPLREYIYSFFELVDTKEFSPRDYHQFNQFMQELAEIFVAVEAYLSGMLTRVKLLNVMKKKEKFLLTSDFSALFLKS